MGEHEDLEERVDVIIVDDNVKLLDLLKDKGERAYNLRIRTFSKARDAFDYLEELYESGRDLPRRYLFDMNFPAEGGYAPAEELAMQAMRYGVPREHIRYITGIYSDGDKKTHAHTGVEVTLKLDIGTNPEVARFLLDASRAKEMSQEIERGPGMGTTAYDLAAISGVQTTISGTYDVAGTSLP